ncbi:MAG TPA: hypothetical protein VFI17_12680 [Solirubrobacterales bacterium]|nr:hypothetical protein [Solirubrobacterales bacterium]
MALQYEHISLKRVVVEANLWPPVEEIPHGTLSRLFGLVNEDEIFSACELRASGASFRGEYWTYDIDGSTVRIRCFGYRDRPTLYARIRKLLDETRSIAPSRRVAFYTQEVRVFADVPEGGKRDVGDVVQKKLLRSVKLEDRESLPGLDGAGLSLVGSTDEYAWHADLDPADDDFLSLFAGISFYREPEPPRPGSDLDAIEEQVKVACGFVEGALKDFSAKFFT